MHQSLKRFFVRSFPKLYSVQSTLRFLVFNPKSYLNSTGWLESNLRKHPCKPDGSPLPWLNYPTIAFLEKRLNNHLKMFEYGGGYSTLYFANRVSFIEGVEHDKQWISRIRSKAPQNALLHYWQLDTDGNYCRAIQASNNYFNVVLVDGRDRINCIKQSVNKLTDDGVIILDDSQRSEYSEAQSLMKRLGFLHLVLEGLKPNGFEADSVSIFYRRNNCLGL